MFVTAISSDGAAISTIWNWVGGEAPLDAVWNVPSDDTVHVVSVVVDPPEVTVADASFPKTSTANGAPPDRRLTFRVHPAGRSQLHRRLRRRGLDAGSEPGAAM